MVQFLIVPKLNMFALTNGGGTCLQQSLLMLVKLDGVTQIGLLQLYFFWGSHEQCSAIFKTMFYCILCITFTIFALSLYSNSPFLRRTVLPTLGFFSFSIIHRLTGLTYLAWITLNAQSSYLITGFDFCRRILMQSLNQ